MDLIDQFIERYTKEYDFYNQAARLASEMLEAKLQEAGIRAIVTYRAKSASRLRDKCLQRHSKTPYVSLESIYTNIVDLAGVRVALYFPKERPQVEAAINELFDSFDSKREFPNPAEPNTGKVFSGYSAIHYRVALRAASLADTERRYSLARIEIQVASVLMHAWSEVEHDLVYKPFAGKLSDAEYAILDQLNGLVLAGEIALEQLQQAGQNRIGDAGGIFANHYDLANFLLSRVTTADGHRLDDAGLGRIDLLFALMSDLRIQTAAQLEPQLEFLHNEFERRPLAEQIIDRLLGDDPDRQLQYLRLRLTSDALNGDSAANQLGEIGIFLSHWNRFESRLHEIMPEQRIRPTFRLIQDAARLGTIDSQTASELNEIRHLRNEVVHSIEHPPPGLLSNAIERLAAITAQLE